MAATPETPARPWQGRLTARQVARVMKATPSTPGQSRADYNAALRAKAAELYPAPYLPDTCSDCARDGHSCGR